MYKKRYSGRLSFKKSSEVINMMTAEYDYETDIAVQKEKAAENFQLPIEEVCKKMELPYEEYLTLKTTNLNPCLSPLLRGQEGSVGGRAASNLGPSPHILIFQHFLKTFTPQSPHLHPTDHASHSHPATGTPVL